jgi:hypothetical protein
MSVRGGRLNSVLCRCVLSCAAAIVCCVTLVVAGCIGHPANPAQTVPVTVTDTSATQPVYWYDRPATVTVGAANFDKLWHAAEEAARLHGFRIDREERRTGLLTTEPLISSQFFEFWRRDVLTVEDSARASLATHRRTLRFEFEKLPDGRYEVTPKALVERQSVTERRITSVVLYKGSVSGSGSAGDIPRGTREADEGILVPPRFWYAIGRDEALEKSVAATIRGQLR